MSPLLRLLLSVLLGLGFFAIPVPWGDRWTVIFDVLVKTLRTELPLLTALYCLLLIVLGAAGSLWSSCWTSAPAWLRDFKTSPALLGLRLLGLPLAAVYALEWGPAWLHAPSMGGTLWGVLVLSVGVIIPLGAVALSLFLSYGALELVGTCMRPLMRPLFRLPGRAALDDLTSWLGSYSVGLYLTRQLVNQGRYTRREAFIIVTAFSTVSIGFVGVVCDTLGLLHRFPLVFGVYFVVVYLLAMLQCRIPPTTWVPDLAVGAHQPEPEPQGELLSRAWREALDRSRHAEPMHQVALRGLREGFVLAATVLGTILSVGTAALYLAEHTPLLETLSQPLVPLMVLLRLPDPELLAAASLAGITEMYLPALIAQEASEPARFFVAVVSISQLIFFSSVGPMMLDMFDDLPVRLRDLLLLFILRTLVLIPLVAGITHGVVALGWL